MITAAGCRTYREHRGLFPELYKITEIRKISLFGIIPFLTLRSKKDKTWIKLFNLLPLLTLKR